MKRTAFFISDSTGITAEVMGEALLSHFPSIEFERHTLPYVDCAEKAHQAVTLIQSAAARDGEQPIIIDTLIDEPIRRIIIESGGFCVDVINSFLAPLGQALNTTSSDAIGRPRIATKNRRYNRRIEAVHFALDNDDGGRINRYDDADIVLVGVSRSGKTPTCLYLAMQFGIFPANYPITDDDLESTELPKALRQHNKKLFGLTINPERLASIRNERLANSRYASLRQCEREVDEAKAMFKRYDVPFIDTTDFSIEEISARILASTGIERQLN